MNKEIPASWEISLTRRQLIKGAVLSGAGLAAALVVGCGGEKNKSSKPSTTGNTVAARTATPEATGIRIVSGYPLSESAGQLTDAMVNSDNDSIKSLSFTFNSQYANGSIETRICFTGDEFYTIFSQEQKPRPGTLVAVSYLHTAKCDTKYPVIELALGDVERVYIGTGSTPDKTYTNMRVYEFIKTTQGLSGKFIGLETIDPKTLKLRDRQ